MIINTNGEVFKADGKTFTIGGVAWANGASDYAGLIGRVTEIRTGDDKETENEGPDIYCAFNVPERDAVVKEYEARFSALYRMPKRIDDLALDCVVMAPEMLEPVAETLPTASGKLYVLTFRKDSDEDCAAGPLGVSEDRSVLTRKMLDNADDYGIAVVLSHSEETEQGGRYVFEAAKVESDDLNLEYMIFEVPAYPAAKGACAA